MKKKKLKLFLVLLILGIISYTGTISAFNSTIGPVTTGNQGNFNKLDHMPFKKAGSLPVFCTNFHLAIPNKSCSKIDDWSDPVKAGVAAIIETAKASNDNMTAKYYYAELAINEFLYDYNGRDVNNRISTTRTPQQVLNKYYSYYEAAVSKYKERSEIRDVSLTRTAGKSGYNLSSSDESNNIETTYKINGINNVDYTVTATVTATPSANNITVAITDENGQGKQTFKSGEKFKVKVSNISEGTDAKITINVKGSYKYKIAANYSCGNSFQTVTPNQVEEKSINSEVNTTIKIRKNNGPKYPTLKVIKESKPLKDENKNKTFPLIGLEISLKKGNDEVDRIRITEENDEISFEELEANEQGEQYCVRETKAPKGHVINGNEYCFTLTLKTENNTEYLDFEGDNNFVFDNTTNPNQPTIKLTIEDKPSIIGILKLDENGDFQGGVKFSIIDAETNHEATTIYEDSLENLVTGKDGSIRIEGLPTGMYFLNEIEVPEGYTKIRPIPFIVPDDTVQNTNNTVFIKAVNHPTVLNISKLDIINRQSIKGAQLEIRDENCENVIELNGEPVRWTSDGTTHRITGLTADKDYCLKETKAPDDYKIIDDEIHFNIDEYGNVTLNDSIQKDATVIMENEHKIYVSKTDLTSGEEIEGAHLQLLDENNNVIEEWDSTKEKYYIKANLPEGTYKLKETIAPEGYVLSQEEITFTVNKDGSITVNNEKAKDSLIIMTNDYSKVYISKQDITTKQELPGAHLVLKNENGEIVKDGEWDSTIEPHLIEGLPAGTYTLTETTAPEGYQLNEETITFTIDEYGTVSGDTVMYNTPIPDVPQTFSAQSILFMIIGVVLVGSGVGLYIYGIKKKKEI